LKQEFFGIQGLALFRYSATTIPYHFIAEFLEAPWDAKVKKDKWKPWFLILNTGIQMRFI